MARGRGWYKMADIKVIKDKKAEKDYQNLLSLCFFDPVGWIDYVFPLPKSSRAYGLYDGKTMSVGIMSHHYRTHLFGRQGTMSGIGGVASYPPSRNRGQVRELLAHILRKDLEMGATFSSLYPFRHSFYGRLGYGPLGGIKRCSFDPEDIATTHKPEGEFKVYDGSKAALDGYFAVLDGWASAYNFGTEPVRWDVKRYNEYLGWVKEKVFLYYVKGKVRAVLQYKTSMHPTHASTMEIRRIGWLDPESLASLFAFLKSFRDQCRTVILVSPPGLPLPLLIKEPNITTEQFASWMARPLDVQEILSAKIGKNPVEGRFGVSVRDEVIESNTGEYVLEGDKVTKKSYKAENAVDFPVFSAFLFGGYSLRDCVLAGRVQAEFPESAFAFFRNEPGIILTENF
jgi:predicted acetyltransferase